LGLRPGVDADQRVAIDDLTRTVSRDGNRRAGVVARFSHWARAVVLLVIS